MKQLLLVGAVCLLALGCRPPQHATNPPPVEGDYTVPETVLGPIDPVADGQLHQIIDDKLGQPASDAGAADDEDYRDCHESCCPPDLRVPDPDGAIECCLCEPGPD